ncbi:MAG: cytochrome c-type biogenesis protein CcmH [Sandaracinaceae bacterium]
MRRFLTTLMLSLMLLPSAVDAQGLARQDEYRARNIERSTLSPFCPGRTLYDCPSPRAAAWRADIRRWIGEGRSETEVRAALSARAPEADLDGDSPGDAAVVALFVLSLAVVGVFAARQLTTRRSPLSEVAPAGPEDTELERRLDDELRRLADG